MLGTAMEIDDGSGDEHFVEGVNDSNEVVIKDGCSALLWSEEGGYSLLLHPRPNNDLQMPKGEMALAAVFLRLADEDFVASLLSWIGNQKKNLPN